MKIQLAFIAALLFLISTSLSATTLAELSGVELKGGAAEVFGSLFGGEANINYVYAQPTGARSSMAASFNISTLPADPMFLYIKGRDDDGPGKCKILIEINDHALIDGSNDFSETAWEIHAYPIPDGVLKVGPNDLRITCSEKKGTLGMPPWFQVSKVAIAGKSFKFGADSIKDFRVKLPTELRDFPEPLPAGKQPGFKWRGTKGWMWTPAQYLAEIPVMAKYKMNFLMNCYGSMCDIEHYAWGNPEVNRWWEDLPASKKASYEEIVKLCGKLGVEFCFSMNPNLCSKRPLNYTSATDLDQLYKHYAWMQSLGVKWFNISLDDISQGIDAAGQAKAVNDIFHRLRAKDPQANMIFTPSFYWGDGTDTAAKPYLEVLARDLDKDVYLFWTGDSVVGNITLHAAQTFSGISKHRLFLWDNYPVNDSTPTMHLGPVINRDVDLCEAVDGYMSNAMCSQNEGNRIPLLTCGDYAYNPSAYDPVRSIGQAIMHLETDPSARRILADLVEVYPGFIIFGKPSTGLNPVREQFAKLSSTPHSRYIVEAFIRHLEDLSASMNKSFPKRYTAEKKTLSDDITLLRKMEKERYGE